jgi:hypothetical protein
MAVDIVISLKNNKIDVSQFSDAQIRKASYRAINHALEQVKTQAIREITSRYNFKHGDIKNGFFILKAGSKNLTGRLESSRRTVPIKALKPVEIKEGVRTKFVGSKKSGGWASQKTREKTTGVRFEIIRGNTITLREAFLTFNKFGARVKAFGKYDGANGFQWNPESKGPSTEVFTTSIHGMLNTEQLRRKLQDNANAIYAKTYLDQLKNLGKF